MKRSWEFYSARVNITLDRFLEGVKNYEDAVEKFRIRDILPPEDLKEIYEAMTATSQNKDTAVSTQGPSLKIETSTTKKKSKPRKKAPPRRTKSSSPKKVPDQKEGKEYFRKVIKKDR